MMPLKTLVALFAVVGLAGCADINAGSSEGEDVASATAVDQAASDNQESEEVIGQGETVDRYFKAAAAFEEVDGVAKPGSDAAAYLAYLAESKRLFPFQVGEAQVVNSAEDSVTIRLTNTETLDMVFSGIAIGPDGVESFSVNGVPLADSLARQSADVNENPHDVQPSEAIMYRSTSGSRNVILQITNNSSSDWEISSAMFVTEDGVQDESDLIEGAFTVLPGATGTVYIAFDDDPDSVDGTLVVEGWVNGFLNESEVTVQLSTQ